jgi:Domain of unknown function (DUF4389)
MTEAATHPDVQPHPIRLVNDDDLRRTRLTVFFRLLLAIPHLVFIALWSLIIPFVALVNWAATLVVGSLPYGLHEFTARYVRYLTHVYAYTHLVADPFPPFAATRGYPIDLVIALPALQNRWTVGFRLVLAIPALIIASVFRTVLQVLAFVGWFYSLATGRMSGGMRDLAAYALRYDMQTMGYALILTDRYPSLAGGPSA